MLLRHVYQKFPPLCPAGRCHCAGEAESPSCLFLQAAAIALEKQNQIQADNIGHKLLSKMGWKEGEGIGASKWVWAGGGGGWKVGIGASKCVRIGGGKGGKEGECIGASKCVYEPGATSC